MSIETCIANSELFVSLVNVPTSMLVKNVSSDISMLVVNVSADVKMLTDYVVLPCCCSHLLTQ